MPGRLPTHTLGLSSARPAHLLTALVTAGQAQTREPATSQSAVLEVTVSASPEQRTKRKPGLAPGRCPRPDGHAAARGATRQACDPARRPVRFPGCVSPERAGLLFCFLENVSFAKSNSVKKFVLLKHQPSKHRRADSQGRPQLPWVNGQGPPPPRCGDTALGPGDRPSKRPRLFPRGEFKGMLPKKCQGCQHPQVWSQPRQSCQPLGSRWPPPRHPTV